MMSVYASLLAFMAAASLLTIAPGLDTALVLRTADLVRVFDHCHPAAGAVPAETFSGAQLRPPHRRYVHGIRRGAGAAITSRLTSARAAILWGRYSRGMT